MKNLNRAILVQKSLLFGHNNPRLTNDGALVVDTGTHTGRSPKAKYIVRDPETENLVDWENNQSMSEEEFEEHFNSFFESTETRSFYEQDVYAGYDKKYRMPVRIHTLKPWHSLFAKNMFFEASQEELESFEPEFSVYSAPDFTEEPRVVISFTRKVVLISGTDYAGEIKKSVFTVLNFLLPQKKVLPMHCSVSVLSYNYAPTIFFGLSGTGKTTLSSDKGSYLVGDDEHGWSDDGVFNFEGGCYAKTIRLSKKDEPIIYDACQQFGTILENVVLKDRNPDFDNARLTENTRASYPLGSIGMKWENPSCDHPTNIIMLTCDAYGILPPVAKLDSEKAIEQFILGYTARVAGTEAGIVEPEPTFSYCFGSPFMPLRPKVYANLLREKIEAHSVNCWLVNTGWTGGPYGEGSRISIELTRKIVNAIRYGVFDDDKCEYKKHLFTEFSIPVVEGLIPESVLFPEKGWKSESDYQKAARKLMSKFIFRLKTMSL